MIRPGSTSRRVRLDRVPGPRALPVPAASLGRAAGVLNTMQLLGATFGIAIVTVVFNASGSLASPLAIARGYQPALSVAAALSVLGALTALALRRTSAPPGPGDPASSSRDLTGAVRTD
jgi:hypothetical protein